MQKRIYISRSLLGACFYNLEKEYEPYPYAHKAICLYTSLLQIFIHNYWITQIKWRCVLAFTSQLFRPMRSGILFETCLDGRTKRSLTPHVQAVYRHPKTMTEKDRRDLVPPDFKIYMESETSVLMTSNSVSTPFFPHLGCHSREQIDLGRFPQRKSCSQSMEIDSGFSRWPHNINPSEIASSVAPKILQREAEIQESNIDTFTKELKSLNTVAWPLNSSFNNQRLFYFVGIVREDIELDPTQ
mmetsp:Transcript_3588/g.6548  ORF Transcript_3588/g.6548 Transcript_3588/m.6548 type:complete len:243 (-) Transcript_3588:74-802(-)